jgi:hypothetical protein
MEEGAPPLDAHTQSRKHLTSAIAESSEDELSESTEELTTLDEGPVEEGSGGKKRKNPPPDRKSHGKKKKQKQGMKDLKNERDQLRKLVQSYRNHVVEVHEFIEAQGLNYELPAFFEH